MQAVFPPPRIGGIRLTKGVCVYCPHCGKQVGDEDEFCEHCGVSLDESAAAPPAGPAAAPAPSGAEQLLFSFGPFGVSICDGPYSMFKWQRKNASFIEMTNLRLCVVPNKVPGMFKLPAVLPSSRSSFEIPYSAITSFEVYPHPAGIGMMDVLDISYVEDGAQREKSFASYKDRIQQAAGIITAARGGAPDAAATAPAS